MNYGQRSEVNPFFGKIECGDCDSAYSRTKYKAKDGHEIRKGRCGSCNKSNGHKVCYNRYVEEDAFIKLFIMSFNEIVDTIETYKEL